MVTSEQTIVTLLQTAARARAGGNSAAEAKALEQAFDMAPGDARVLNTLGMHALGQQDFLSAVRHFEAAVAADSMAGALWINLATAYRGLDDRAGEERALKSASAINQLDFMAQLRLAELYERSDDGRSAALHWKNVVQMAAGIPERPALVDDALRRGQAFLLQHNQAISDTVDARLGPKISALGEESRRIRACIDASLGRRQIFANRCEGVHFPFLPADEFFDRRYFPWMEEIENRTDAIRKEAVNLLNNASDVIRPYVRQAAGTPNNKWSPLDNSLSWGACFLWEYGRRNDVICDLCPDTAAALEAVPQNYVPGKAPTAFFSILQPHAHIPPHTGVTNTRAIIHLPLVVPEGCRFRVGGETRPWLEGHAFAFDDTIDHEAWNDSDEIRIVLIFDVWNPHMSEAECALVSDFFALADKD